MNFVIHYGLPLSRRLILGHNTSIVGLFVMKIKNEVLEKIINEQRPIPPESGGILGGSNGIVTTFFFDDGEPSSKMCSYSPNTELMDKIIEDWQKDAILFMGIYHTHFWDVESLSEGDKFYIDLIMSCMPDSVNKLYFPLVLFPSKTIVPYYAIIDSGELYIEKDILEII